MIYKKLTMSGHVSVLWIKVWLIIQHPSHTIKDDVDIAHPLSGAWAYQTETSTIVLHTPSLHIHTNNVTSYHSVCNDGIIAA